MRGTRQAATSYWSGSHNGTTAAHEGLCLVDDPDVAERYAGRDGTVTEYLVPDSLIVEECEGYDHDENSAPADDDSFRAAAAARGVDILRYEDEDEYGREHTCWRLVSDRAVATVRPA